MESETMADIVIVEAAAPWASWRPPEALTYHRSLSLPPYTTLVGLLGAALGIDLPEAYCFLAGHQIRLGVGGWCEGQARDLWKFQKLKDKEVESDVLLREVWIDARLAFVFDSPDPQTAQFVADAFKAPAFPLTAGPSDALLKVVAVRAESVEPVSTRSVAYALIFREILPNYNLHGSLEELPLHRTVRRPMVERLPTGFWFEPDGRRRLQGREIVSFVGDAINLDSKDEPVVGYRVVPQSPILRNSPTFVAWKEGLSWIIPVHRYDSLLMPEEVSSTPRLPSAKTPRRDKSNKPTGSI